MGDLILKRVTGSCIASRPVAAALGVFCLLAPAMGGARTRRWDWPAAKVEFMAGRFADALPIVDACIRAFEAQTTLGHSGMSLSAIPLSYSYLARAQILAFVGRFPDAESSLTSADSVAVQHGFDNAFVVNWARLHASAQGFILESEGRLNEAIETYKNGTDYGRAALLALDLGDAAQARRLLARATDPRIDAHVAEGRLAEASGDTPAALRNYQAAWADIIQAHDAPGLSLPMYFVEASRVRTSLARLGAPVP
jgi:tetratricopeptide (TPR) repeat protein